MCPIFGRVKTLPFKAQTRVVRLAVEYFFGIARGASARPRARVWSGVNTP